MNERMKLRMAHLLASQAKGCTTCPRCGGVTMKRDLHTNALSRHVEGVYICDECGTAEALLDFMHNPLPITEWAWFKPRPEPSPYKGFPAEDVLAVIDDIAEPIKDVFLQCITQPDLAAEYRLEALETIPGLSEMWINPFAAKINANDGAVLLQYRLNAKSQVEYTADIIHK